MYNILYFRANVDIGTSLVLLKWNYHKSSYTKENDWINIHTISP